MTVKEKIIHHSPTQIRLHKEGTFWVGYEQSAFLLAQIKQFKPSKRIVVAAGQEVVTVGMPDATLRNVLMQMLQVVKQDEKSVTLESVIELDKAKFEKWKAEVPLNKPPKSYFGSAQHSASGGLIACESDRQASLPEGAGSNLYSNLPVFKAAYELLRFVYRESGSMTRTYRFTLGENLQKAMSELLLNVYRANCDFNKTAHIAHARENTEMVRLMLRVAFDEKQITIKHYIFANERIESVSKQLTAWGRSSRV